MTASARIFDLLSQGDEDELRRVLKDEPSASGARDAGGVSLLMHGLYRGKRSLAEYIGGVKVELDVFEASALGKLDRLRELLHDPSAPHAFSADGFTALHFACFFGQAEAARILINGGADVNAEARNAMRVRPLHSAASARNLDAARLLLEHGANVNARQHGGWVPIHSAAQNGDRNMIELLLKHGADPSRANDQGQTPAAVARDKGHGAVAALLG